MSETTGIEWADHTASPWYGCAHATLQDGNEHPGCLNCYAERMAKRNPVILGQWGPDGTRVVSKSFAENCRRWNKAAQRDGVRRRVFPSFCDPFEETSLRMRMAEKNEDGEMANVIAWHRDDIGVCSPGQTTVGAVRGDRPAVMDDALDDLFAISDECRWLDFVLLTKRPQNVRRKWPSVNVQSQQQANDRNERGELYRRNVWLLTSVSDQQTLEEMVKHLLKCRDLVPVLGLCIEPLLGPIDLSSISLDKDISADVLRGVYTQFCSPGFDHPGASQEFGGGPHLDWVIVGGESGGSNARPCNIAWIRSIVEQCRDAGVPCFVKQLGSRPYMDGSDGERFDWPCGFTVSGGKTWLNLVDRKGGDPAEWPEDLRVREFPNVKGGAT